MIGKCVACFALPQRIPRACCRVLIVCVCPILERLVANVTAPGRTDNIREASLEALGYICQDIVSSFVHSSVCSTCACVRACVCVLLVFLASRSLRVARTPFFFLFSRIRMSSSLRAMSSSPLLSTGCAKKKATTTSDWLQPLLCSTLSNSRKTTFKTT